MQRPLRIAILNTKEPLERHSQDQFANIYENVIREKSKMVEVITVDVLQKNYCLRLSDLDAIIITGSSASINDEKPWIKKLLSLLKLIWVTEPRLRLFGSCFGHQVLCKAILDLDVIRGEPEIGVQEIQMSRQFAQAGLRSLGMKATKPLMIQMCHTDHVKVPETARIPEQCIIIGSSKLCKIQGTYWPQRLLTFQGHPELDRYTCLQTAKAFFPTDYSRFEAAIELQDSSLWAKEVLWKFINVASS